jgi:hypothetical protein
MRKFPIRLWYGILRRLRAARPSPGANCRLSFTSRGYSISADFSETLDHPWRTLVSQDAKGNWLATLTPGFVNGTDPTLTAWDATTGTSSVHALTDGLPMELTALVDRSDPTVSLPIPAYFSALGAGKDQTITYDSSTQSTNYGTNPPGWRRLKSCDIYLSIARIAVNGSIQINDASGTSGSVATYVPVFDTSAVQKYGLRPRLLQTGSLTQTTALTASQRIMDALSGSGSTDLPEDTLLISTVYFLSGPDDSSDYTAYVQHSCFYNLCYASQSLVNINSPPAPITIFTGLAGGLGDTIANQILSGINDAADALAAGMASVSQAGKFWTI